MYFRKQQISDKINQISQQRHSHDKVFSDLQHMIAQNKKYQIVYLRKKFTFSIQELHKVIQENQRILDLLTYRCEHLSKEGMELNNQKIRIQSLKEYFSQLKQKVKRQNERGEQIIVGRQRWQLVKYQSDASNQQDDQQSLLNSHSAAKQTTQIARGVLQSISNQSNRIQNVRQKMGSVLKNINFSGNIAQLLRTRTRQDNRLIALLSIGLVIWIMLCVFVFKPLYRGT